MNTNLKTAKEKMIQAGYRLEGDEEVLLEEARSNISHKIRGKV